MSTEPDQGWPLAAAVRATVLYADLFDYPLDLMEIQRDLIRLTTNALEIRKAVSALVAAGALDLDNGFVVQPGRTNLALLRDDRTTRARALGPLAIGWGRAIGALPFVRMVAITGSLAAGNPDDGADLDYLIVAAPGRLWLARAFAIGIVRLARKTGVAICPNYLLTTNALDLDHQDLFTAHELLQMVPVSGTDVYWRMRVANGWTACWLPNRSPLGFRVPWGTGEITPDPIRLFGRLGKAKPPPVSRVTQALAERLLDASLGERLERWERQRQRARLSRGASPARFTADLCEGHFGHNRRRVLTRFLQECAAQGIGESTRRGTFPTPVVATTGKGW